jgi:hypothetical protein
LQYVGPTQQVKDLTANIEEFKTTFENPSEYITGKDGIIHNIARKEIFPAIEKKIEQEVDTIIDIELRNQRTLFLKGKKDKMPKEPKIKDPPEKLGPGEKALVKTDVKDLFTDVYCIIIFSLLSLELLKRSLRGS